VQIEFPDYASMEKQASLQTIDLSRESGSPCDESGSPYDESDFPNNDSPYNDSTNTFDLFSHDSTHVRLVIEAERQTSLAREKVANILQKMSKEGDEGRSIDDERDEGDNNSGSNRNSSQFDDSSAHSHEEERVGNDNKFFEQLDATNNNDIEHLTRCILPLSPSGAPKQKGKRISGQFEFKRMNSVLTVVRSMDEDSNHSYQGSMGSRKSKSSRFSIRRKGSMHSKESSMFSESNALTDDAWMQDICAKEARKLAKLKLKEKKTGDLPPRMNRRSYAGSHKAEPSVSEKEDVISVVSHLSAITSESITNKRSSSPMVVTEMSLREARIPHIICLKTQQKLTTFGKLKRRISFNKGKATI